MRQLALGIVLVSLMLYIPLAKSQNLGYVGSILWTGINDVEIVEGVAYCAFENGLMILDVSDPAAPFEYGKAFCPGEGEQVAVSGRYAYLADGSAGLKVIDVYGKDNPVVVGSYDTPGIASDVTVAGNYAYIADDTSGLQIIDISSPRNPVLIGSFDLPDDLRAGEVIVVGNYAYVGTHEYDASLFIFDITDPALPTLVGSVRIGSPGSQSHGVVGIIAIGDYLYIGASLNWPGLYVVDISNPQVPTIVSSVHSYDNPADICGNGNYVFLLGGNEITAYTISDSLRPKMTGRSHFSRDLYPVKRMHFAENKIFIAGGRALEVADASDPDSLHSLGLYRASRLKDNVSDIAVSGNYAYVPMNRALHIVDISNPNQPALIDSCALPDRPSHVRTSGNFAYASIRYLGLYIIDATDPHHSFIAGTYIPQSTTANIAALQGNYAYLSTGLGLEIVDISNPANPTLAGQYWRLGPVAVSGAYAYISARPSNEFQVISLADPANPTLVGSLPAGARDIAVQGNYAYLTGGPWLNVIDVSNPSAPVFAGSCSLDVFPISLSPIPYDIRVAGNYAYLAILDGGRVCGGAMVVDVSDPYNPAVVSYFYMPGYSYNIDYQNGYCYLIGDYSMTIFSGVATGIEESPETPSEFSLSQNYPNPFNAQTVIRYSMSEPGRVSLQIYNLLGQKVATLFEGIKSLGQYSMVWQAEGIPSGVYFARLESNEKAQTVRMVVLK